MRFTFIKIPRHRKFQYDPIYYNPEKEEREARERRLRKEMGMSVEEQSGRGHVERIRGGMRRRIKSQFEVTRTERKKSNIRLIIILVILIALFYYLLNSAYEWYSQFFT
ncbi:MAG: hypothetical protein R6U46_10085 [Marinilabilia sp.]